MLHFGRAENNICHILNPEMCPSYCSKQLPLVLKAVLALMMQVFEV